MPVFQGMLDILVSHTLNGILKTHCWYYLINVVLCDKGTGEEEKHEFLPSKCVYMLCWCEWNDLHRLIGSGTIQRYGLLGAKVTFLNEVFYWGWILEFKKPNSGPMALSFPTARRSSSRPQGSILSNMSSCALPCFPWWWCWAELLNL